MAPMLLLEGEKLLQLARIIRNKETEAIKNLKFKSEEERAKYLRDVSDNYHSTIKLLDDAEGVKQKYNDDQTRSSIAADTFSYMQKAVNISLQGVRNYALRASYLTKISTHSKDVITAIETVNIKDTSVVARLAEEVKQYKDNMKQLMIDHQSPASRNFSKWLKSSGTKFEDLVTRYQNKRGLGGVLFKNLTDEQKLLVYNDIIKASGRGGLILNTLSKITGAAGILLLIVATGVMVWDIFTSEHVFKTATKDVMVTAASIGGALVGQVVGEALVTLVAAEASAFVLMVASIVGGIVGAFVIGTFVSWLMDLIFDSGGSYPLSTDNHHCYVAPLPDGEALARQIAHQ